MERRYGAAGTGGPGGAPQADTPPTHTLGARAQARARAGTLPIRLPPLLTSRACARRPLLPRAEPGPRSSVPAGEGEWRVGTPGCSGIECGSGWEKPERSPEGGKMRKGPRGVWGPGVLLLSPLHLDLAPLPRAERHSDPEAASSLPPEALPGSPRPPSPGEGSE